VPKTPSRALDEGACAEEGSVAGATDGLTVDDAGAVTGDTTGSLTGRLALAAGALPAGAAVEEPPVSVTGFVAAATGVGMFDTLCAAVAEPLPVPPPPQATSDVQMSVETTLTVTVREKSVIWVSSISGSIGCGIRLFALSLLDDTNITVGKTIPHGKKDFYEKLLGICNRRLTILLWALRKYYGLM
jgi:hypothetical protein